MPRLIQLDAVDMGEPVVLAWADEGQVIVLEPRSEPVDQRAQVQAVVDGLAPRHAASVIDRPRASITPVGHGRHGGRDSPMMGGAGSRGWLSPTRHTATVSRHV